MNRFHTSPIGRMICSTWNIPGPTLIQIVDCSTWNNRLSGSESDLGCSTWNKSSFQWEKYGTGSSPGCVSVLVKSMERLSNLGGVPVLSRPSSNPSSFSELDNPIAAASPARPPDC